MARIGLFRRIPELLTELGTDADATLESLGLARDDFEDPENEIPYFLLERLLVECERRTQCAHFGLLLGETTRLAELGLLGRVARCAATAGEGLAALERTYNLHRGGGIIHVVDDGETASFVFAIAMPGAGDTRQYQMTGITIAFNLLEDLCGAEWRASEVRFAFRSPPNLRPFHRYFRAPVRFDAGESLIRFAGKWLATPLPPVDASIRRSVAAELATLRELAFADFPVLVRDVIRRQLSIGPASIESVSAALSMHRRSLERRLACVGEDYRSLQQSVKHEVAVQLLRETDLSVQEIADFLRFSSAANFATAFRRWTARTPTQFRAAGD